MNIQPKPSIDCMPPVAGRGTAPRFAHVHAAVPAASLPVAWPLELEVEPWRP